MTREENYFSLSTLQIWSDGEFALNLTTNYEAVHSGWRNKCLDAIREFNEYKGQIKFRSEIRYIEGYNDENCNDNQWKEERRNLAGNGYYFGLSISPIMNPSNGKREPRGIIIYEDVSPDYKNIDERKYYYDLFPFRFITIAQKRPENINDFLVFQLNTSFDGNANDYKTFLINMITTKNELGEFKLVIENFIENLTKRPPNRDYTHREICIADRYLVQSGYKEQATAKEMKDISSKRYKAFLSLTPKQRRPPTEPELENVRDLLSNSPKALELLEKDISMKSK